MWMKALVLILLVALWLGCNASNNERSRSFVIKNRSGYRVTVYWIKRTPRERVLLKRLDDGKNDNMDSTIGHMFEFEEENEACVEEECRRAVFEVRETFGQVVTIDDGLELVVEDDTTRYPQKFMDFTTIYPDTPLRLNTDFSLFPEMDSITNYEELDVNRINWQMRRLRRMPTSGLIENKLLSYSLLKSLGIPTPKIYYGAFRSKSMGDWGQYDRESFIEAMTKIPPVAQDHLFVIKPATAQGTDGVIVMNNERWKRGRVTFELLADYVETFLDMPSDWGLQHDHRGVLVQSVLPQQAEVRFHEGSFDGFVSENHVPVFELKTHVVFGKLCGARISTVPIKFDSFIDIHFCNGKPVFHFASGLNGADVGLWKAVKPLIESRTARLAEIAQQIASAYGVDLYRLDVFMDDNGLFVVNEVTYASFSHSPFDCANPRLLDAYKTDDAFNILNGTSVLESLLQRINVSYGLFMTASDYHTVEHKTEEYYDSQDYYREHGDFTDEHDKFANTGVFQEDAIESHTRTPTGRPTGMCGRLSEYH